MSFDDLKLQKVTDIKQWDEFIKNSEDGTIFSSSLYLEACDVNYDLYWITLNSNVKAGLCLIVSEDRKSIINDDLVIYSGLIFNSTKKTNKADILNQKFLISQYVASELTSIYQNIEITFCPEFNDPRPFQFYGYGNDDIKKYNCTTKFTSYVDVSSMIEEKIDLFKTSTFENIRPPKRRDIKRGISEKYSIEKTNNCDLFLSFYENNIKGQNIDISEKYLFKIKKLIDALISNDKAVVINISDNLGNYVYSVVYCWDKNKAYYLFGSGTNNSPKHWQGVIANWEGFIYVAKQLKIRVIDLEGINSPERGKFKLSLGGSITPYYNITL